MKIKELDKNTAEQIAAGEVIENPASVVKELVENALDAQATSIDVSIEGGGKTVVTVTDNGRSIAAEDLPLAFKRFATSKISAIDDLQRLSSLGFRGEALPSIAAVARAKMTTRVEGAFSGSEIILSGGEVLSLEEVGAPAGTKVEVRELFYNTPGRKKFLRANNVESTRISNLLSELALAHPEVAFSLKSGKRELFRSSGDGVLLHVIGSIYGNETAEAMIELNRPDKAAGLHLHGFISAPHLTRSSRRWITVVVNGRLIRNAMLVNALERGYGDLLPRQRHPLAVLHLHIPAGIIDVNVHPAKVEIRFQEPDTLKSFLYRAVKTALQNEEIMPVWSDRHIYQSYRETQEKTGSGLWQESRFFEQTGRFEPLMKEKAEKISPQPCRLIGQFLNSYLVAQKNESLLLIDQHAAHERIIYHKLEQIKKAEKAEKSSQLTLPLILELPAAWRSRMPMLLPLLDETGFQLESMGGDSYAVRAVPFLLRENLGTTELYDLLERIVAADDDPADDPGETVRKTIACHRSIKAGQILARQEMEELLRAWENTPQSSYCPHGRPAVTSFERVDLEKLFLRRGT